MGMYHRQQPKKPTDKQDERKLLSNRNIEKGTHTTKVEKSSMLGTHKKSTKKPQSK